MVIVYSPGTRRVVNKKTGRIVLKRYNWILKSRSTGRPLGYHMTEGQALAQERAIWARRK